MKKKIEKGQYVLLDNKYIVEIVSDPIAKDDGIYYEVEYIKDATEEELKGVEE